MDAAVRNRAIGRRIERLLAPAASILLGAASGFFCFAVPARLIGRLIDPAVIGGRLSLALIVALIVGAATWGLFSALDRPIAPRRRAIGTERGADAAPVLRRADSHPDAPARRPIFAGSDLGTPLDLIDPLPLDWTEEPAPMQAAPERTASEDAVPQAGRDEHPPIAVPVVPSRQAAAALRHDHSPSAPPVRAEPVAPARSAVPLGAMMARLEASLARKALVLAGAEANVTALKREIRPIGGTLSAAVEELQQRTAARR